MIVPEYNEDSRQGDASFDRQLDYLYRLSRRYDVFLVDDASTDGSWDRIKEGARRPHPSLHLVRMDKNGQKVMAIMRALEMSTSEYVLLTDFDSRLLDPEAAVQVIRKFEADPLLAAVALRLVPEGTSLFSRLQDLEYSIGRMVFGAYTNSQKKLRCVSGAGGIWRRDVLLEILREHSGRHNGDDMEATAIALRKGYRVQYEPSLVVLTMVPQNAWDLFKQRKRWELGALETYDKERKFFVGQAKNARSRLGHVTLLDWYTWCTTLLAPLFLANWFFHTQIAVAYAIFELGLTVGASYIARNDIRNRRDLALIPLIPVYRFLGSIPRMAALFEFVRAKASRGGAAAKRQQEDRHALGADAVEAGQQQRTIAMYAALYPIG